MHTMHQHILFYVVVVDIVAVDDNDENNARKWKKQQ